MNMKILLIGEYSGVHTELSKQLKLLGHRVLTVSDGDSYKDFPRDISIVSSKRAGRIKIVFDILLDYIGLKGLWCYLKNKRKLSELKRFDIVQIINPVAIEPFGALGNFFFLSNIFKNNKNVYLCALGDDCRWVDACLNNKYKYSALDNLSLRTVAKYSYSLRYKYGFLYRYLQHYVEKKVNAIIPGLVDYELAYRGVRKTSKIIRIALPKNILSISAQVPKLGNAKIVVFHGWQTGRELKKGNYIFDQAMKMILKKYGHEVIEYNVVKSVTYNEYIKIIEDSDIFLDQVYSYDRGVNALLGMAFGCAVFSGFEVDSKPIEDQDAIGVNAIPDVDEVYKSISYLIDNREQLERIKQNAIRFVRGNHDPEFIANEYLHLWKQTHDC